MRGIPSVLLAALLSIPVSCALARAADETVPPPAVAPTPAVAAATDSAPLDALLDKIEEARQKVTTLKASVDYQKKAEVLDIEENFSGTFSFKMPRFVRMDLKEKGEEGRDRYYIIGEKYGWIAYPDKHMAERFAMGAIEQGQPMEKAPNPFEFGLTHGIKELKKAFDMRITGEETIDKRPATVIELTPKPTDDESARRPEEKLVFWIDKETSLPARVSDYKSRGQIVETFTLSNVQVNVGVRPLLGGDPFEYHPPGSYQVIAYGEAGNDEGN